MKRLFTLLLVIMGMVCTVSADNYLKGSWNEYAGTLFVFDEASPKQGTITITNLSATTDYYFYIEDGSDKWFVKSGAMNSANCTDWTLNKESSDYMKFTTTIAGDYTFKLIWYKHNDDKTYAHLSIIYPKSNEYTVHFKKPDGWSSVYAYRAINGMDYHDTAWPGSELSASSICSDFYDVTISDSFNRICFSDNGNDSKKSGDIVLDFSSTEYWVTDNATASSTLPADDYKYTRSVTPGSYGTICLPYNATIEGATVYSIVAIQEEVDEPKRLRFVENANVTAGYAYLFQAGEGNQLTATFTSNTKTSKLYDNGMLGNLSPDPIILDGSKTAYVIQGNVIKKVVDGGTGVSVPQYRAYITLSNITTSAPSLDSNFIFIPFEDAPSGINTVQASESKVNGYFNLNGQRVAQPTKGLYIVNGKKVVLK